MKLLPYASNISPYVHVRVRSCVCWRRPHLSPWASVWLLWAWAWWVYWESSSGTRPRTSRRPGSSHQSGTYNMGQRCQQQTNNQIVTNYLPFSIKPFYLNIESKVFPLKQLSLYIACNCIFFKRLYIKCLGKIID